MKYKTNSLPDVGIVIMQNEFEKGIKLHTKKKIQTIRSAIIIVNIVLGLDIGKDKTTSGISRTNMH